ncbi:MAG: HPr family phosphocarrier protein [Lachnospiraceae bacterium]|nr:HPr family phosphocarrier protein [Lachnospiraceae bacterium]
MVTKDIIINIPAGQDARTAAFLVQVASRYDSNIMALQADKKINAKSIMGMMSINVKQGMPLRFRAEGPDEEDAIKGIEDYLTMQK